MVDDGLGAGACLQSALMAIRLLALRPRRVASPSWLSLAANAASTVSASVVVSWFLSGSARCAQVARASGSSSCSSSGISCSRSFRTPQAAELLAWPFPTRSLVRTAVPCPALAPSRAGRPPRPLFRCWRAVLGFRRQPRRWQVRRIEIIFAGNPDQREQGIAPGIGERGAESVRRGRLADRTDRPVRGHPFAGGVDKRGRQPDQAAIPIDGRGLHGCDLVRPRHLRTRSRPLASGAYRKVRLPSRGNGETMVAVRDFSGFAISACALASAAASAPTLSLELLHGRPPRQAVQS